MLPTSDSFRDVFAAPAGRETVRAFLLFGMLVVAMIGIAGELVFRDLSLGVLRERLDLGRNAAREIAGDVTRVGGDGQFVDYRTLWANREQLQRLIEARITDSGFIRQVEVLDRFGVRVLFVSQSPEDAPARRTPHGSALPAWPALADKFIEVPLAVRQGRRSAGEIRLGISQSALQGELVSLRRSLWLKIGIAAALALTLLVLGLFYVLHLIRKNRMLEQARQSAARASYVGLLAAGLAHEIRNPLNAMNMNLQMLEEELQARPGSIETEHVELLDLTKNAIKRLEQLVNNFLRYARPAEPRREACDLNVVVREVLRLLEADFRQHGVELATDLEPLLPRADLDETQFKQALINLLMNARQVMKDGGTVSVATRAGSRGEVVIEVRDTGPGIPPETRDRVFEVFFSNRGGGTGLGLPIARQIVERHGGTIEFDTELGVGTTFRIRLPRHRSKADPAPVEAGQRA